jgi:hypothetical protein
MRLWTCACSASSAAAAALHFLRDQVQAVAALLHAPRQFRLAHGRRLCKERAVERGGVMSSFNGASAMSFARFFSISRRRSRNASASVARRAVRARALGES